MPHLVSGSCSSPRAFALGFLPTPPRGDAVALPLAFGFSFTWRGDLHPTSYVPCPAHTLRRTNGAISAVRCRRWLGSLEVRFNLHIHIHWQLLMGMSILKKTLIVACFYRENILYPSSFSFLSQEVDAV